MVAALPEGVVAKIADKAIGELRERLREKRVELMVDARARDWLARNGTSAKYGARPLGRLVQTELGRPLAEELLFGALRVGGVASASVRDDGEGLSLECTEARQTTSTAPAATCDHGVLMQGEPP